MSGAPDALVDFHTGVDGAIQGLRGLTRGGAADKPETFDPDAALRDAVALALDGSKDTRGTHHLTTEYKPGLLIIEPLQDKSKLEALIKNHEHVKDLALDTLKLHDKTVARCGDGRLTSYSFSVKGRGWEVTNKPDSPSMKPVSVYGITFKPNSATSFDKVIDDDNEKTNQRVQRVLIRFREHCREGNVKMIECNLNYIGMTHKTSTYERFHGARGHLSGQSGAGVLGAFLKEPLISKHFVMYHRCLATPKTTTEAYQLEAVVGNLVFVGGIFGLNQAHMGPWRYIEKNGRPSTVIFLGWCVNRGKGGLSVAEILSASQRRALFVIESTTSWE